MQTFAPDQENERFRKEKGPVVIDKSVIWWGKGMKKPALCWL